MAVNKLVIDPLIISSIIGLIGVIIGIGGYAIQNWQVTKREIETKLFLLKRERYEKLIKNIGEGIHTVQTEKKSTSIEYKKEFIESMNILYLYGSDEILKKLKLYLDEPGKKVNFQQLILAIRKDLQNTDLNYSDIEWFRAL